MWVQPQAHLLKLNPADLLAEEMHNHFEEWITDCPFDENAIHLTGMSYACVNFPFAREGRIHLKMSGVIPQGTKILLSDCYLDKATFFQKNHNSSYDEYLTDLYVELTPPCVNALDIAWNEQEIRLQTNTTTQTILFPSDKRGFNHMGILLKTEDAMLNITQFDMWRVQGDMETGIEY